MPDALRGLDLNLAVSAECMKASTVVGLVCQGMELHIQCTICEGNDVRG